MTLLTVTCGTICIGTAAFLVHQRCCRREAKQCKARKDFSCNIAMAVLLTCFSIIGVALGEWLISPCDDTLGYLVLSLLFLSVLACTGSLLLWMRVALAASTHLCGGKMKHLCGGGKGCTLPVVCPDSNDTPPHPVGTEMLMAALRSRSCCVVALPVMLLAATACIHYSYGTYGTFAAELDERWGFMMQQSVDGMSPAPVWLGEFGTDHYQRNLWWQHMIRYMQEREVDFAYWSLNGEKRTWEDESYGIWKMDHETLRYLWKIADLQKLMLQTPSS